ncbi:MAG: aldo/keto reductase [Spirochaetales bacterium]|nr:aldo/keto reductase [Spirochaetales bacterium]MCF7939525.1 aldo/keto reductase [Spirochaetales bacterium]
MQYRKLGKTGLNVSELSLGTWQIGGKWGSGFDDALAEKTINEAIDNGINFIDTADVYEDGKSEAAVGRVVRSRSEEVYVATKCGRQISPHVNEGYTPEVLRGFVEDSLRNLGLDCIDLIQLHCPPTEVYYRPEIFELFDRLKEEGKIRNLGVSVEKVEEALKAINYPNVSTVQIIFNMFRMRPAELFFREAKAGDIGIIVRVPLASGLLTGKFTKDSSFSSNDHRNFNRNGAAFDVGETFAGIDFEKGLDVVEELKELMKDHTQGSLAQWAIRWVLMHKEVSCTIPGASRPEQLRENLEAEKLPEIPEETMKRIVDLYERRIAPLVHHRW